MKLIGKTRVGGMRFELPGDTKRVARFNVVQQVRIVKLSFYTDGLGSGSGNQVARGVIYDAAGNLVAQGDEIAVADGQPAGWVDLPFTAYEGGVDVIPGLYDFGLLGGAHANTIRVYGDDPSSAALTGSLSLTVSGNEITDAVRAAGTQGDGLTPPAGVGIWEGTTNLVANGGFETDTSGWSLDVGGSALAQSADAKFGTKSGLLTTAVTTTPKDIVVYALSGLSVGLPYAFSKWIKVPSSWSGATPGLSVRAAAVVSGNEITDAARLAALAWGIGQQGGITDALGLTSGWKNLLSNPSFETNLVGWTPQGTATLAQDATWAQVGTESMKVTV